MLLLLITANYFPEMGKPICRNPLYPYSLISNLLNVLNWVKLIKNVFTDLPDLYKTLLFKKKAILVKIRIYLNLNVTTGIDWLKAKYPTYCRGLFQQKKLPMKYMILIWILLRDRRQILLQIFSELKQIFYCH